MTYCPSCGVELPDGVRFCPSCGARTDTATPVAVTPKHQLSQGRGVTIAAVSVGVVVVVGVAAVFLVPGWSNSSQRQVIPTTSPVTTTSSPVPTPTFTTTTTTTEEPTTTTVGETDLDQLVAEDKNTAASLVGQWVPQISSKSVGLVVGDVTYGYPEIMADFRSLRGKYPQAIMVRSDDYTNFAGPGFWVTVIPTPYSTPDAANAWCDSAGFAEQDCYASRLMHTGGPAGNSKLR